jgi:hypothetical protein
MAAAVGRGKRDGRVELDATGIESTYGIQRSKRWQVDHRKAASSTHSTAACAAAQPPSQQVREFASRPIDAQK